MIDKFSHKIDFVVLRSKLNSIASKHKINVKNRVAGGFAIEFVVPVIRTLLWLPDFPVNLTDRLSFRHVSHVASTSKPSC